MAISSAISGEWSTKELSETIADTIFFTGLFMFISTSINYVKYLCRSRPVTTVELVQETSIQEMSYNDMLPNEKAAYDGYSRHGWKGNYPGQTKGIRAGGRYVNDSNILPKGLYREFDINPTIPGIGRDATRFVVSDTNIVYLTRNHYTSFYKIIP